MQSEWCGEEVRLFLEREQELFEAYPVLRSRSCIFPISFRDFQHAEAVDAAVRDRLMERRHFDFQAMLHLDYDAPEAMRAVSNFVTDIRDLLKARLE